MSKANKLLTHIKNPYFVLYAILPRKVLNVMPDKMYLKLAFHAKSGYKLNLKAPKTFNEKLQWIKLFDRKTIYQTMVDKYEVKKYVASLIGEEYIIPTYGLWERFEDIDFDALPDQFVLKCTHDSGGLVICKEKKHLDYEKTKEKIKRSLNNNYYYFGREWPYKHVQPRIIAEKYMEDKNSTELRDYKVLCFNGEPKLIELHQGRFTERQTQDFYDTNWEKTDITQCGLSHYQITTDAYPRPDTLEKMLELSRILSKGIPHVRVDWYSVGDKLFFGELTFFDGSGFDPWDRMEDDLLLGSWITLPEKTINN